MENWRLTAEPIPNPKQSTKIVHYADAEFPFLHDTMIAQLDGRLLMAWYNCTQDEIAGRTVIRGRWSNDQGETWSTPEIICEDMIGHRHMVPVTFSEHEGDIWAYVTCMSAHDRPTGYVCVHYENGSWVIREERPDLVLFNTLPQLVGDEWIVGGRMAPKAGMLPMIPIIAKARPASPAQWRIQPLPGPWEQGNYPLRIPETALFVEGSRVEALSRNEQGPAMLFFGEEYGDKFAPMVPCELPIAPVKTALGTLPDGRQYFIFNRITPARDRSELVMALRKGPGQPFDRAWLLAKGENAALGAGPNWHYPCACAAYGKLFISCTSSSTGIVRHAALFALPLEAL